MSGGVPAETNPPARPAVLIVDDDDRILNVVEGMLRDECDVHIAHNTSEAEAVLMRSPVQLVVCDEEMPGERGLAFLARTRALYPRLQRILLTGHTETDILLDAINKSGVSCYLVKPVSRADLQKAVRQALADYAEACRLRQVELENVQLQAGLRSVSTSERRRLAFAGRLLLLGSLGIAGMMLTALLLGVLVLIVLYLLKSGLGIDLVPDFHFWPWGS